MNKLDKNKEKELLESFQKATILHNFFFFKLMSQERFCKPFLEMLLNIKIKKLIYIDAEKTMKERFTGRGIRLDILTEDAENIYNIEMQASDRKNHIIRSRLYQGNIDVYKSKEGEKVYNYENMKTSFIIFICNFDSFGFGLPCYSFENYCTENKEIPLNDGTKKIFINLKAYAKVENKELREVLAYFNGCEDVDNYLVSGLKEEIKHMKQDKYIRSNYMMYSGVFEDAYFDGRQEGRQEGMQKGMRQGMLEVAESLLDVLDDKMIALKCKLSLEEVEKLRAKHSKNK